MSSKRPRSISSASSSSSSSASASRSIQSRSPSPPASKLTRLPSSSSPSFTCSLPPTCSSHPATFSTAQEAEAHYGKIHALMCDAEVEGRGGAAEEGGGGRGGEKGKGRARRCGAIFPEQRLMDLHQNELHNPLLAEREARGERIYECYLPTSACSKKFHNVKGRRLHLIDAHGFPSSYFFAVVKEGIGPLLRSQGPAASLLRPDYDPNSPQAQAQRARSLSSSPTAHTTRLPFSPPLLHNPSTSSSTPPPSQLDASCPPPTPSNRQTPPHLPQDAKNNEVQDDPMMDSLTSSLASASLAFVPRSVGAKKGKGKK